MILPLGDSPNPRGVPVVTYALLAANVAVYVLITLPLSFTPVDPADPDLVEYVRVITRSLPRDAPVRELLGTLTAYDLFVFRHGFRPAVPALSDLFFSLFLHAGFLHLFGNMLFLWIYGDNVEHRLGRLRYLLAYLGTGVAATLSHTVVDISSGLPMVGASGAISGLLGFYFIWFPHNRVRLFVFFFPLLAEVISVPARLVLGMYLIVDNLLPFLATRGSAGGGVAYGAHIGGFVVGWLTAWVMDRRALRARPAPYRHAPRVRREGSPAELVHAALDGGRFAEAARLYFALPPAATQRLLTPEESLALAAWLRQGNSSDAALAVYRRHLRDYPNGPGAAEAHLGAGVVLLEDLDQPTPAYQHFLEALDLDPSPETAARVRAGIEAVRARQKFQLRRFGNR